jgi:sugar phosphate isomerase/epimerase
VFGIDTSVRLGSLSGPQRQEQLDLASAMLDIASQLSASYLRVFGGQIDEREPTPGDLPRFAAGLATLSELARKHEVTVLVETHDSFSTGRSVAELLKAHPQEANVGVLWDVLHSFRHGESFAHTLDAIGDRLALVHLKDSANFAPDAFDLTLLGDGILPLAEALRLLAEHGYDGYLSFEWEKGWHPEIAEADVALPHFVRTIRALLDAPPH